MSDTKRQNMRNIRSVVLGKAPSADQLEFGEIAINYNAKQPFIAFKVSGETGADIHVIETKDSASEITFDADITYDDETIVNSGDTVADGVYNIFKAIIDNEKVAAQALTYLNNVSSNNTALIEALSAATEEIIDCGEY